ncbi:MAG TPA: hypothetical protein VF766_07015, partial [Pyrinomonadaceae bacterium]
MADDDALELWRALGVSGARDALLPLFRSVDNHPLVVQALASEIARYRPAPGDFEQWRRNHPGFNPFRLPLVKVKSHVLEFALRGLDDKARRALQVIAAFRMPASYDTLVALLTGEGKPCADERKLDAVLTELEDRGLVGWDKRANRYDLHPIVRGVVWSGLGEDTRRGVYTSLHTHFEALPKIDDYLKVNSLEDLTPAIELYNTLVGLGRYDDAGRLFSERLSQATLYRLSANRQQVELLEMLFPDGLDQLPRVREKNYQAYLLNALALAYKLSGQPGRAPMLYRRANGIYSEAENQNSLSITLGNLSETWRMLGAFREAEACARRSLVITHENSNRFEEGRILYRLGFVLTARGMTNESKVALHRALLIRQAKLIRQGEGHASSHISQRALWLSDFARARQYA